MFAIGKNGKPEVMLRRNAVKPDDGIIGDLDGFEFATESVVFVSVTFIEERGSDAVTSSRTRFASSKSLAAVVCDDRQLLNNK